MHGQPVIDGFEVGDRASDGRGQVLAPWPNRLTGGRYTFGGQRCQAPLNEPDRGNAIHGLVRWLDWTEITHTAKEVVLGCVLRPQPGYEWQLSVQVGYRVTGDGLTVSSRVVNTGGDAAPFGLGFHPYLTLACPSTGFNSGYRPASICLPPIPTCHRHPRVCRGHRWTSPRPG